MTNTCKNCKFCKLNSGYCLCLKQQKVIAKNVKENDTLPTACENFEQKTTQTKTQTEIVNTKEYKTFVEFVAQNKSTWFNLMSRLIDEFEYEQEETKEFLKNRFSKLGKTSCRLVGDTFCVTTQLGNGLKGKFKLNCKRLKATIES